MARRRACGRGGACVVAAVALALAACGSPTSAPPASPPVAAPTCPPGPSAVVPAAPPSSTRPGLSGSLVPPGPSAAVVCRYAGGSSHVIRSAVVPRAALAPLVAELDSDRWQVVADPGVYNCPTWDGSTDVVRFVYPSGPDVVVTVDLGGCDFASNGVRTVGGHDIGRYLSRWVGGVRA